MKTLGILFAVLLVLIAPVSRAGIGSATSEPETGTEVAVIATEPTRSVTGAATEVATILATEAATTEPTAPSSTLEEAETESAEPTALDASESAYAETGYLECANAGMVNNYTTGYSTGYSDYDRELLARAIYAEAGCSWIPDDVQLSVGSVVLNRVQSGYYPDTIEGVLYDPGQYVPSSLYAAEPDERAYRNADALLSGGSVLPANVLGQNGWGIGDGIYDTYYDETLGSTIYFTYIY